VPLCEFDKMSRCGHEILHGVRFSVAEVHQ
jgi:hypothetical protein